MRFPDAASLINWTRDAETLQRLGLQIVDEVQILRVGADPRRTSEGVRRERIDRVSLSMKSLIGT